MPIAVSSRPTWSIEWVPGQAPNLLRETLSGGGGGVAKIWLTYRQNTCILFFDFSYINAMYYNHIHNDYFLTSHPPILRFLLSVTFIYLGKWLLPGAWATYHWIVGLRAPRAFPDSIAIALGCLLEWNGYKILLLKTPYTLGTWLREINQNSTVSFLPAGSSGKYCMVDEELAQHLRALLLF